MQTRNEDPTGHGLRKWDRFAATVATLPLSERPSAVWEEMRHRAEAGEFLPVERYLDAAGLSDSDPGHESLRTDVVYGDVLVRREAGHEVNVETYVRRFPDLADSLSRQFSFDEAFTEASPPAAGSEAPIPDFVGRYRVIDRLGSGGQGDVYRAVHPTLGRDVALKVCRKEIAADSTARLLEEGRILAELDHPQLPRVYDVEVVDGRPVLAFEFLRGRTLDRAGLRPGEGGRDAASLVLKLARAVAAAHARGVTHLDLKPKNVLIDEAGEPRLLDFGLARWSRPWDDPDPASAGISGTLQYMAPEQARGESERIGPAADVFGLGGILFYLLCGRPPYRSGTTAELLEQARRGDVNRTPLDGVAIPATLKQVCLRALAADPVERYASAGELASALEPFARPPFRLDKATLAAGLSAALMVAVGIAAVVTNRSGSSETSESRSLSGGSGGENDTSRAAPVAVPLTAKVWRAGAPDGTPFAVSDAAPLRNGDELAVTASIPDGLYAALYSVNAAGAVQQLASLRTDDTSRTLRFPQEQGKAAPLAGPAGPELLLVVTTRDEPPTAEELLPSAERERWRSLAFRSVYSVTPGDVEAEEASRDFGQAVNRSDPEGDARQFLNDLRLRLAKEADGFGALAFPHDPLSDGE